MCHTTLSHLRHFCTQRWSRGLLFTVLSLTHWWLHWLNGFLLEIVTRSFRSKSRLWWKLWREDNTFHRCQNPRSLTQRSMRWGNSTLCIGDWLCISRSLSRHPQIWGTEEGISPPETRPSSGSGEQTVLSSQTTVSSQQELRTGTLDTEDLSPSLSRARLDLLEVPDHNEMLSVGTRLAGFSQQWKDIQGDCRAARVLRSVVLLEWESMPPLTRTRRQFPTQNGKEELQEVVT